MGRSVPALSRRAQAALGSHPGFTAGVLVPASHGEELLAFQVCTKPSNLSSHGGVIKAVPTKQNELNCFPRPGESVLGSGKNPFPPALEPELSAVCSALPGPAWVNATRSSSALREGRKPGSTVAGVCTMLVCTTLPVLWRGASGCSHAGEEFGAWRPYKCLQISAGWVSGGWGQALCSGAQ